ncbi:response regulator [Roseivirga pacifica]|uniref:ATP-binding protein n=2 Tax=Roseivirga pacifica TaxID=1267423 RepID=UPI002095E4E6|nr:ATP-binding protein [Roseivirga pacifica]MCO6359213.1 response regulator [Roseivirga pacifica]MCO6365151.1 response regulator [Roseivirga pacifica]MCO6372119.1 response regulator [Roseivirga pacifica]MCO6375770.1 response regulator [Roseivirga pacifica]MCO6379497.1 response regulator [Roseivirga pacifica]
MTKLPFLKRRVLAWIINIALLVITFIILFTGYQGYQRLNTMVHTLEKSAEPNYNLLILKEVTFFINEMERTIDIYRNDLTPVYLRTFNDALEETHYLIDSLKNQTPSQESLELYDSLSYNIKEWAKIQTKMANVNSDLLGSTLEELTQKIQNLSNNPSQPNAQITPDADTLSAEEKKNGFFKRLFGRKNKVNEEALVPDSVDQGPTQSELLQREILAELEAAKTQSLKKNSELRFEIHQLEQEAAVYQEQIVALIEQLETIEIENSNENVKSVEALAKSTNQEIVVFSALSSALLLITIISQLNYIARNRKYQRALSNAKVHAEELASTKEKFLANMSHEIRTPMNAIAGFTNQLLKTDMTAKQRDQLEVVKNSSDHLIHLLNDILDLSKLQANKVKLEEEIFDIKSVLFESMRIFEDKAEAKGIALKTEFETVPRYVTGDPHRLRQMMTNLISNAIKYTDHGSVTLHAKVERKDNNQMTMRIAVKDTGNGIPKAKQKRIFEEFEQAHTADQQQGTGLGLAITNMLVRLHKGSILIDSEENKGTEMTLLIPYKLGRKNQKPEKEPKAPKIELSNLHILIADDEPFNLKLLEAVFSSHDVSLVLAHDGSQAYEQLANQHFDLAILDVKMPGLSGFEIVEKIRDEKGPNQSAPFIALTATISDQEKLQSKNSGFNSIMRKPFDEQELLATIQDVTQKKPDTNSKPKEPNASHLGLAAGEVLFDLSTLKSIGDKDFVDEMIHTFKQSANTSLKNLRKAVKLQIRNGISDEAHKMLPPARHLSAKTLVTAIEKLQNMANTASFEQISNQIDRVESIYTLIKKDLDA